MISEKQEFLLKAFCILVLITLNILIVLNGLTLDCNKCNIHFQAYEQIHTSVTGQSLNDFYLNINDIYDYFKKDICLIEWNNDNSGFRVYDDSKIK